MLKDVTLGQFFPGKSVVHRLDPRMKLILVLVYIVMLFIVKNPLGLAVSVVLVSVAFGLSKVPIKLVLRGLKPVLPIVLFTAILNMFFVDGDVLFQWWIIKATYQGLYFAGMMAARIVCLIAGTSLLTYTTSPIALTDGLERLLSPLKRVRFPVHELAMMMTIALRFIPTLIEETDKIISAQKARGADLESGGLIARAKALIPVLIPLFVSAFRRADELALAMECRCYRGGEGRTRMKQLSLRGIDWACAAVVTVCLAATIAINLYAPVLPGMTVA